MLGFLKPSHPVSAANAKCNNAFQSYELGRGVWKAMKPNGDSVSGLLLLPVHSMQRLRQAKLRRRAKDAPNRSAAIHAVGHVSVPISII